MMSSSNIQWHKSSYSNGMGGECLEVAFLVEAIAVRDSKFALGPQVTWSAAAWQGFIQAMPATDAKMR
ncbi:DUF397 domain-containing protein [Streptomyces shenzhenensis]|uniref:DUF397 domain-containing protein n=1 Tax=Streptomyces shenzhenensis TaxID=943815 RepID=UPI001F1A8B3A|nr:DUF397 domain-containing protein [Streptomyces shenzhenensis]